MTASAFSSTPSPALSGRGSPAAWPLPNAVIAVASGFPLLGDYRVTLLDVEGQARASQRDSAAWEQAQQKWADQDTDTVEMVLSHEEYMAGLHRRGVPFDLCRGYDHEGLNDSLKMALPAAMRWLLGRAAEQQPPEQGHRRGRN